VRFDFDSALEDVVQRRRAARLHESGHKLRASVLDESDLDARTPKQHAGVISVQMVPGNKLEVDVAAKGGGLRGEIQVRHA